MKSKLIHVYFDRPKDFHSTLEVSTVFIECSGKVLFLQHAFNEESPGMWAVPGGKLEIGETPLEGLVREMEEELQIGPDLEKLETFQSLYIYHSLGDYELHLFRWKTASVPLIQINREEHRDFVWQPIDRVKELPLIRGQIEAFNFVYSNDQVDGS